MKELMCEMCGSNVIVREGGFYICQACGTRFPTNDFEDNIQQFNGDGVSDELENLYELARRARENGDSELGFNYYNEILIKNPYDWEAQFYVGYFMAFLSDFLDEDGINDFYNSTSSAVAIIERLDDVEEKNDAISLITAEIYGLVDGFYQVYFEQLEYMGSDHEYYPWYVNSLLELTYLLNYYGDLIENVTDETYEEALSSWIYSIDLHTPLYKYIGFFDKVDHDEYIDIYVEKIREYDPDYEKPKPKKLFGIL